MESKAKKPAVKKAATKKTTAKAAPAKKTAVKKTAVKKAPAKKAAAKKTATKKAPAKKSAKPLDETLQTVKACWQALDDKKAENLKILDVQGRSPITNYFVIATATSEPHMRALAGELEKTLKDLNVKSVGRENVKSVGREYSHGSGWMVVDAFDFMAHIFLPQQRGMYGIESLWKDANEITF